MAVYVDDAIWYRHGRTWCHLLADSEDELHRFAVALGVHRISYQGPPKTGKPHYDLTAWERRMALARGAVACSRQEIVAVLRRVRGELPSNAKASAARIRIPPSSLSERVPRHDHDSPSNT